MHEALHALLGEDRCAAEAEAEAEDTRVEGESFSCRSRFTVTPSRACLDIAVPP
jgi:hypothetical protein